ncbi:MAG: ribosome maturation factor RimM [Cyanobacteria bacterium J06598_1]
MFSLIAVIYAFKLTSGRYLDGKNNYLVKLEGVNDRNQAEDLRGTPLVVPVEDRLPLDPGEFHVNDLIGLQATLQADQTVLGTVTNVFTMGHDLLEVTVVEPELSAVEVTVSEDAKEKTATSSTSENLSENASSIRAKAAEKLRRKAKRAQKRKKPKTLLIPFVEDIVPVVDIAAGKIEITPPPGLIEL